MFYSNKIDSNTEFYNLFENLFSKNWREDNLFYLSNEKYINTINNLTDGNKSRRSNQLEIIDIDNEEKLLKLIKKGRINILYYVQSDMIYL